MFVPNLKRSTQDVIEMSRSQGQGGGTATALKHVFLELFTEFHYFVFCYVTSVLKWTFMMASTIDEGRAFLFQPLSLNLSKVMDGK